MALFASVDIGSNAARLLVGEVSETGALRRIRYERVVTRLAEGLIKGGDISARRMRMAIDVLKGYSALIAAYDGLDGIRAVGTHALRVAGNADEFLRRAKEEASLGVEVISPDEEARLSAIGAISSFEAKGEVFLLDIGGGSTEWAFIKDGRIIIKASMPVGVIGLAAKHIKSDPPAVQETGALDRELKARAEDISGALITAPDADARFVFTSGTASTVASIDLGLERYGHEALHGHKMSLKRMGEIARMLGGLSLSERRALRGLEPERADLIIPGVHFTIRVMEALGMDEIIISDRGLPEGVMLGFAGEGAGAGKSAG